MTGGEYITKLQAFIEKEQGNAAIAFRAFDNNSMAKKGKGALQFDQLTLPVDRF